ncbi:HDOD domain-containing protein [Pseudomonas sp. R5(2019)]|uniref:HDOD domain-containing protein n=1 Tax=Pseudomonas sp. R5(2019) TaxID=2697566 RepID=UPI00141353EF|nr:HDOD domain-containing protein [Pseudomonas sp. R5(2019)]NBA98273.1 HDOD domain-containing protein [Pseudomonas sp. R5(2019)]
MTAVDTSAAPKVLIAEADPWMRELLVQTVLSVRCDAQLTVCADGLEALTGLGQTPDLILATWELPGLDGLELLRRVRQRRMQPVVPFILLSARSDGASVREVLPFSPSAYLTKPLNMDSLKQRLNALMQAFGQEMACEVPPLRPGMTLHKFLEGRRASTDGGPLLADVQVAVKRSLNPHGLNLKVLEEELRTDPQITAVLIAAANSAAQHRDGMVQTLMQALLTLGTTQSMNLVLGLALKRSAKLSDPALAEHAERYWKAALHTAEYGRTLARQLEIDQERCYCAGLLHCLGDLALLRCLQEWLLAGGTLEEGQIAKALDEFGAAYGSALRTRWRLPLELRELIAAVYQLGGGVYSRDELAMNLAAQMARLPADAGLEGVADSKSARLLKMAVSDLGRLRLRGQAAMPVS